VVVIYVDEQSLKDLRQPLNAPMDRSLHAHLLQRLKKEGARAVVMDFTFSEPGPNPEADREFAQSIRENGRVI